MIPNSEERNYELSSWTNETNSDCCEWEGLECNRTSGRVTKIALSNFYFSDSTVLNLSLLHPFEEVQSLDFSFNTYNSLFDDMEGYKSLSRLRNLEILNLSSNHFNNSIFPFLNAATSLTTLILGFNYMDGPFPVKDSLSELKNLTNLELLDLSGNGYNSSMPDFTYLKKLKALDLSANLFSSSTELQELKYLSNLEVLRLDSNEFYGPEPIKVFCEMKNLQELYLHGNYFGCKLPLCLGSLNKLRVLDLSSNQLSGNLPSSFSNFKSLEYLTLSDNNFEGLFSLNPLANLTNLKVFKLSSTSDMIQVDTESTWLPKFQLSFAALPFCSLEKIPSFLMHQKNLRVVDLSSNSLSGNIPTELLANNPELEVLYLQNNSFTIFQNLTLVHKLQVLDFSANDIGGVLPDNIGHVFPSMEYMNGSDNRFQGNLPSSMDEMKNISFVDLSHNNFSGELPKSLFTGCFSLKILQLSHNQFGGQILPRQTNLTSLQVLKLDNNFFTGEIGDGLVTMFYLSILDMSNNLLRGPIPSILSDSSYLSMLLLSNNLLEGTLPSSLLVSYDLTFLDLSGNLLSGTLPTYVNPMKRMKLFLHNNSFTGTIPIKMLEIAEILDLRNNKLFGSIPKFVNTEDMSILLLKGNNLTGSIPWKLCDLTKIGLLDLSDNKLNGIIPSCLYNLSFGLRQEGRRTRGSTKSYDILLLRPQSEFYRSTFLEEVIRLDYNIYTTFEVQFAAKQRYDSYTETSEFSRGTLDYMYGLDLSNNELSGVIPTELGDLPKLRALNLSRNFLSSSIPDSFSRLKDIESLDLSYNMLQGRIPYQLNNLTSLAVFNVSFNNLTGVIPQERQFNTFNESSYLGNPLLCGPPTDRNCGARNDTEKADNEGEEVDNEAGINMSVFYWSTASTYVAVLTSILVLMCFDCPWRRAWLFLVDDFIESMRSKLS